MQYFPDTKKLKFPIEEILFIDTEAKMLPFRHAAKCKIKTVTTWNDFIKTLKDATGQNDLSGKPNRQAYYGSIKCIIIDSFTRITYLLSEHLKASGSKGYDFWRDFAESIENLMMKWECNGKFIVYSAIDEVVRDADSVDRKVVKIDGKKMEGLIESYFTMVMFTHFNPLKKADEAYQFCTNTDGKNSAKSPMGMFKERYIPNDMSIVLGAVFEYYDMANNPEFNPSPAIIVGQSGSGKSTSFSFLFAEDETMQEPKKAKEKTK